MVIKGELIELSVAQLGLGRLRAPRIRGLTTFNPRAREREGEGSIKLRHN